jgi:hypothetical protein
MCAFGAVPDGVDFGCDYTERKATPAPFAIASAVNRLGSPGLAAGEAQIEYMLDDPGGRRPVAELAYRLGQTAADSF